MSTSLQVTKDHYDFQEYISKDRWISIWHQIDEIARLKPERVMEIGPGPGVFKGVAAMLGIKVETMDIDPELHPDFVGSVLAMPFPDRAYDVVCAFQMLEHLPYEKSLQAFQQMARVARKNVVISLPDAKVEWPFSVYIPRHGKVRFTLPKPTIGLRKHIFDGEHYWEVNKVAFPLERIIEDFSKIAKLEKSYRVPDFPYHRFFIFSVA